MSRDSDLLEFEEAEQIVVVETTPAGDFEVVEPTPDTIELYEAVPAFAVDGDINIGIQTYVHTQTTPAATWIINHNLGFAREPTILLSSAPTIPVWTDVEHGSLNTTTLTFPSPVAGTATF